MPLSKVKARLGQPSESQRSSKLDSLRRHGGPAGRGSCLRGTAQLPGGRLVPWPGRPQTCGVRVGRWMSQSVACSRSQPGRGSWEQVGRVCNGDLPGPKRCQSQQRARVCSGEAARGPRAQLSGGQLARRTPTSPPSQLSASLSKVSERPP